MTHHAEPKSRGSHPRQIASVEELIDRALAGLPNTGHAEATAAGDLFNPALNRQPTTSRLGF
jgi:hypothetical protein